MSAKTNNSDQKKEFPILITLDCIRLVFVDDFKWEESENIFVINYRKIINKDKQ